MRIIFLLFFSVSIYAQPIRIGLDRLFDEQYAHFIKNKRVGLITNHTGVDSNLCSNIKIFKTKAHLVAIFCPEHGIDGAARADEKIDHSKDRDGIHIYSLHGETRRPTEQMLKDIDVLVYDIQEIGCRSYTYISTLFYAMEEAAKKGIPVVVLDRPNPMGGKVVDGPMLQDKWRSFMGYINIPYCHGMTVAELARFFNAEYKIGCKLHLVPMEGWKRKMTYKETGLAWIPTSPYIPESDTPFFYASTGILGALGVVNIGIGYTLPFKVIGAPWIDGYHLAEKLNSQQLPGVKFVPFYYQPFYGKFAKEQCEGVKIVITDPEIYRPLSVQYMLIGMLKSLYPIQFQAKLNQITDADKSSFCKVNGNSEMLNIILKESFFAWKLIGYEKEAREAFIEKRKRYLLYD
ncbi:MAG: DUF1343 domain-containing protein [Verrucomicrobia bacterium]|nr:DUF1343 domain-containing protein [Verrucomicrobiota bacterium]